MLHLTRCSESHRTMKLLFPFLLYLNVKNKRHRQEIISSVLSFSSHISVSLLANKKETKKKFVFLYLKFYIHWFSFFYASNDCFIICQVDKKKNKNVQKFIHSKLHYTFLPVIGVIHSDSYTFLYHWAENRELCSFYNKKKYIGSNVTTMR